MRKCEKCGKVIYKKDPLTVIGTCIGGLIAMGVVALAMAGFMWCLKLLVNVVMG